MKKLILTILLLITTLYAENFKTAIEQCKVYNNMKHSKNSGNQTLKVGDSYRIIEERKEQYFITISGIATPNRWVDKSCFGVGSVVAKSSTTQSSKPKHSLLALSWQNAFCETNRYKKECKRAKGAYTDTRFSLHGFWPQPRDNVYCNVSYEDKKRDKGGKWHQLPKLNLSDTTRKNLLEVMPGLVSNLQRHEWIKHGTCSGMLEDDYYAHSIALTQQINNSKVGAFFAKNIGKAITLQQVRFKMNESFGRGSGKRVELRCRKGLITEIWIHLGSSGNDIKSLIKDGKEVRSKCQKGRIDRVGF